MITVMKYSKLENLYTIQKNRHSRVLLRFVIIVICPKSFDQGPIPPTWMETLKMSLIILFFECLISGLSLRIGFDSDTCHATIFCHQIVFNPIALRKAKIVYNFGLSECNRVKQVDMMHAIYLSCNIFL